MKVLMLGWEFPPHISGGLGTACFGLTQGLSHHGVEVLFVVPRARGDEDARFVSIVGANRVPIVEERVGPPRERSSDRVETAERIETAEHIENGERVVEEAELLPRTRWREVVERGERVWKTVEVIAVDSPLVPYSSEAEYEARVRALERVATVREHREPIERVTRVPEDELVRVVRRRPVPVERVVRESRVVRETRVVHETSTEPRERITEHRERITEHRERITEPGERVVERRLLEITGGYGSNLMEEVGRYAMAVEALSGVATFDVIHAHDWMSVPAGLAAKARSGKPLVVHVHACEHDRSGERPNEAVKRIEQRALDEADAVVCVSHYTQAQLEKHYRVDATKMRVVHNALTQKEQVERVRSKKAIDEPIVLFLGRVTSQKGPEYFLEAAARVVKVRRDVKFVMSGSGDMLPSMIEQAAKLGIARHVHFTGFLKGEDVERMYAMADLYVMPSVSEPFGISPLEAMALDVPVIVSRQSGVAEVLRSALKVDYWDVEDIANKILALLRWPALTQELMKEGREEVRAMRWEIPAGLVRDVYRELAPIG